MRERTVYDAAGGEESFLRLAQAHHDRCLSDPVLEHPFSHGVQPDHVPHLGLYWAEVFGGPPTYSRFLGGHSGMLALHAGQGADADLGERFLAAFTAAVDDVGLGAYADLRAALVGYMRWAVEEVMAVSPPGSPVGPDLPMPAWAWDGLQPRRAGSS